VVLGNVGGPDDRRTVSALKTAAGGADPLVAEHAVWALGRLEQRRVEKQAAAA
jgi:hypothetical protein